MLSFTYCCVMFNTSYCVLLTLHFSFSLNPLAICCTCEWLSYLMCSFCLLFIVIMDFLAGPKKKKNQYSDVFGMKSQQEPRAITVRGA